MENIEHVDGLILNLAACKNDKNLDQLMDILIKTIKQDDLNYLIELKEILTPKEDKGLLGHSLWAKSLELNELSENILPLSLGIVNSVARLSQRRILDRTNFIEKLNNMTSQLRNYIAQNKTMNAIEWLSEVLEEHNLKEELNEVIIYASSINRIKSEFSQNLITSEAYQMEIAKVNFGVLGLINKMIT